MLTHIHPKLPMRDKAATLECYVHQLGFEVVGGDYEDYLMVRKDQVEIHFFKFSELDPKENYGQVYIRTDDIETWYRLVKSNNVKTTLLEEKAWGQREFSILDPDNNLLTFGEALG